MTATSGASLQALLRTLKRKRVLVIGDVMLDQYIRGISQRLSPEANAPVVEVGSTEMYLGGASNVAANASALGARVTLVGIVGSDEEARIVRRLARKARIQLKLVTDDRRPTTLKTRVTSHGKHLARVDRESRTALSMTMTRALIRTLPAADAVIVSDYGKGVVTSVLVAVLKKKYGARNIVADVKPARVALVRGVRAIKLNLTEASAILGAKTAQGKDAARTLSRKLNSSIVLTKGAQGTLLYDKENNMEIQVPARAKVKEVRDVSGAGDTVTATLACLLAAGAGLVQATEIANHAGGLAVSRHGTVAISATDLM